MPLLYDEYGGWYVIPIVMLCPIDSSYLLFPSLPSRYSLTLNLGLSLPLLLSPLVSLSCRHSDSMTAMQPIPIPLL
jgi:hypothetical protein